MNKKNSFKFNCIKIDSNVNIKIDASIWVLLAENKIWNALQEMTIIPRSKIVWLWLFYVY